MRILLCDDDPMILVQMEKYLKEYFQKAHLRVPDIASYTSGDALLRSESTAEIAFLDVEIPGLSGIYTGEKLKKHNCPTSQTNSFEGGYIRKFKET